MPKSGVKSGAKVEMEITKEIIVHLMTSTVAICTRMADQISGARNGIIWGAGPT